MYCLLCRGILETNFDFISQKHIACMNFFNIMEITLKSTNENSIKLMGDFITLADIKKANKNVPKYIIEFVSGYGYNDPDGWDFDFDEELPKDSDSDLLHTKITDGVSELELGDKKTGFPIYLKNRHGKDMPISFRQYVEMSSKIWNNMLYGRSGELSQKEYQYQTDSMQSKTKSNKKNTRSKKNVKQMSYLKKIQAIRPIDEKDKEIFNKLKQNTRK